MSVPSTTAIAVFLIINNSSGAGSPRRRSSKFLAGLSSGSRDGFTQKYFGIVRKIPGRGTAGPEKSRGPTCGTAVAEGTPHVRTPSASQSSVRPPRRGFLSLVLGTWAAGVVGAILYPIFKFITPPEVPEATSLTASAGKASDLKPNMGKVVPFGAEPAIVVRTPGGELKAFTAVCTHLNCTVQYRSDLQQIWCACHNGHYDLNGKNVSGPPPKPLQAFEVHERGDELVISRHA
jgi:Rieske Fe-S protein